MKKIILIVISIFALSSCHNLKNTDNEQIEITVKKYFHTIEKNDLQAYSNLISNSNRFPGGVSSYLFFLHNNYSKINTNNILLKKIKIKDTIDLGEHQKYILYILKNPNPVPFGNNKDLRMYLFFRKAVGYNQISEFFIIGNIPDWEDQKPINFN